MSYRSVHSVRPSVLEGNVVKKAFVLKSALALAMATPLIASAESQLVTGTGITAGASARLDFRIIIPGFIALRVGPGAVLTNNNTIGAVEFTVSETQVTADGTINPSSGAPVDVALLSNVGNVAFEASGADLTAGTDTISLSRISATVASGNLAHPTFNGPPLIVAPASGRIVNRSGTWNFTYNHQGATDPVPAGTYSTQVTYTASLP